MVPQDEDELGNQVEQTTHSNHPFMRGIMNFDDYNYNQYNDYILIEEPNDVERRKIINDRKKLDRN